MVCRGGFMGFRSAIDPNLCSKPALSECRGGFMGFRSAIDTNLCSKPALSCSYSLFPVFQIVIAPSLLPLTNICPS
jgi:hypothetical protein